MIWDDVLAQLVWDSEAAELAEASLDETLAAIRGE